jgi:hypothetical protein
MGDTTIATDILAAVADAADEIGKSAIIRRVSEGDWIDATNKTKGKVKTNTDHTVTVIPVEFEADLIDDTIIQRGDKQVIVSIEGLGIDITTDDIYIDGTNDSTDDHWKIINVKPTEVSGSNVVVILHIRK